jgi:hypothetical protein
MRIHQWPRPAMRRIASVHCGRLDQYLAKPVDPAALAFMVKAKGTRGHRERQLSEPH